LPNELCFGGPSSLLDFSDGVLSLLLGLVICLIFVCTQGLGSILAELSTFQSFLNTLIALALRLSLFGGLELG